MKTTILFIFAATFLSASAIAQPTVYWEDTYGGGGFDQGHCVEQTEDLGFIIAGRTSSYGHGGYDVYLIKTDSLGTIEWHQAYGGPEDDIGYCVQQTADYGYIVTGYTQSFGAGNADVYLIKTDSQGDTLWTQTYGEGGTDEGSKVQQTDDGGFIICGTTNSYGSGGTNALLIKTDGFGQEQWHQAYGGNTDETGWGLDKCNDGGYILTGYTREYDAYRDIWLVKTNAVGTMTWEQHFGGTNSEFCYSVQQTLDGGFFLAGYSYSFGGWIDVYLVKTDILGQESWSRTFGSDQQDDAICGIQTSEGGYIIAGSTNISGLSKQAYIIKTNSTGNELWNLTLGWDDADWGYNVKQTHDGGYVIVGAANGPWSWDIYMIRLGPDYIGVNDDPPKGHPESFALHGAHPNPFNPTTTITFDLPVAAEVSFNVFDINGRNVGTTTGRHKTDPYAYYPPGNHSITFDGSGLASGVYIYRLQAGEFIQSGKMVLLK